MTNAAAKPVSQMTTEPAPGETGTIAFLLGRNPVLIAREAAAGEAGLGSLAKALGFIAGFTALSYVFGFLCINAYLSSRGVVIFSAVDSEYLAVGLCFGFFYLVTGIIVRLSQPKVPSEIWQQMLADREKKLLEMQRSGKSESFRRGYAPSFAVGYVVGALLAIVRTQLPYYVLVLFFVTPVCYFSTHDFRAFSSWELYAWIVLVPLGVSFLIDFARQTATAKWLLLPLVLVTLLLSAVFYGRGLYPYVSSSIGGGTPVAVRFVVDAANKANTESALNIKIESNTTPTLRLLLETSDSFLVMVTTKDRSDQIVQLKKDQVKAVVYGLAK